MNKSIEANCCSAARAVPLTAESNIFVHILFVDVPMNPPPATRRLAQCISPAITKNCIKPTLIWLYERWAAVMSAEGVR